MTPAAVAALTRRLLGRTPSRDDLQDWARVLEHVPDDVADQALLDHLACSPHAPTLADIRRGAVAILNDRAHRAEVERHRLERETGQTADGQPFVPMPPAVRDLAAQLAAKQRARAAALEASTHLNPPSYDDPPTPTWPCCAHCTGTQDPIGHPPHRTPCDLCPTPEGATA